MMSSFDATIFGGVAVVSTFAVVVVVGVVVGCG